jgi:hypothetical protein
MVSLHLGVSHCLTQYFTHLSGDSPDLPTAKPLPPYMRRSKSDRDAAADPISEGDRDRRLLGGAGGAARQGSCRVVGIRHRLSQEALAHEYGINRNYLSGVERSERNVSIDNIARKAAGLWVTPSNLLKDS